MVTSKRLWLRGICMVLIAICLLPFFSYTVYGAGQERKANKTLRVGYMIFEGYQEGGEGEIKSGSAYQYYQKLRYYTGWEYEYVYGSIDESFKRLEEGEIDIMAVVTYTPERGEKYLFSQESHGTEISYLYVHEDEKSISAEDLRSLSGKRIGVLKGSYQEVYFDEWAQKMEVSCDVIAYDYVEDLHKALTARDVDAIIEVSVKEEVGGDYPWKSIHRFYAEPLYFIVNKDRPDILKELNAAQAQIVETDEFYSYEITQKYQKGINFHNAYLSETQQKYIDSCGVLKVGYLEGTNPMAFTDTTTGKMSGLAADYLDIMSENYGMKFEPVLYSDETQMIADLKAEKIDIALPLGCGYWTAEQLGISLTAEITTLPMSVIYKDSANIFDKIAVMKGSVTQEGFVEMNYPEAEIYYVDNTAAALKAVEDGLANCYFVRSSSMDLMNERFHINENFHTIGLRHHMEAFMATRIEDNILLGILDKGITLITDAEQDTAKIKYAYPDGKTSLWAAIKDNALVVGALFISILLLFTVIIVVYRLIINAEHMRKLQIEKDKAEEAATEAERAQRAKTDFLSQMSHDIRTPMNAIIGFTNFAKETEDIEVIKTEYIPKIETASNQLLMLINDVLEMSRIESGKLVFRREINDLVAMIESVVSVMRLQAEEKSLQLKVDIDVTERTVNCDQNHFSRILMNLLSNAVKFTPVGGKIEVAVKQLPFEEEGHGLYEIKVSDNGIGMAPEFLEKVFEPFERERTSTVSRMQGTGLGMSIVKRIVETSGDSIYVESKEGEGTTFTIQMKLLLGSKNQEVQAAENQKLRTEHSLQELKQYFTGKRILLAEDNEFNSTIAQTILENAGFVVETAADGYIAVQKVINAPTPYYYDVILMDVQMPVMSGYEATKAIRSLADERAEVKIIAVTANAFESDKIDAKNAGMDSHISKPLDVNVLYNTLLEITEL